MIYTIDLLDLWNTQGLFANRMALDQLGVFGHSNGGGSAGQVAIRDDRIKAAANLDGIQWGSMIDSTYQVPFLFVSADWPAEHQDINSHIFINKSTDYFYESKILKTGHTNFMDIPLMIPVAALTGSGAIDPYLGMEITSKLVPYFFDRYLKNDMEQNPVEISNQYDLLEMTVYKGDSII
jgi:predicted dienelactone hydrolase